MKKYLILAAMLLVAALAWAALDDVTTGHEANFTLEYAMVAAGMLALGLGAAALIRGGRKQGEAGQ